MANCATTFIAFYGSDRAIASATAAIQSGLDGTAGEIVQHTVKDGKAEIEILGPRGEEFSHLIEELPADLTAAAEVWPEMGGHFHLSVRKDGEDLGGALIEVWEIARDERGPIYLWRSNDPKTASILLAAIDHDLVRLPGGGHDLVLRSADGQTASITRLDDETVRVETSFGHSFPKVSKTGEILDQPICQ